MTLPCRTTIENRVVRPFTWRDCAQIPGVIDTPPWSKTIETQLQYQTNFLRATRSNPISQFFVPHFQLSQKTLLRNPANVASIANRTKGFQHLEARKLTHEALSGLETKIIRHELLILPLAAQLQGTFYKQRKSLQMCRERPFDLENPHTSLQAGKLVWRSFQAACRPRAMRVATACSAHSQWQSLPPRADGLTRWLLVPESQGRSWPKLTCIEWNESTITIWTPETSA